MNLFRRTYTGHIKKKGSHEIDPEDVFLDSENLSELDVHQLEGHLERPLDKKMFYATVFLSSILVLSFTYRLFSMQVLNGDYYTNRAERNHLKKLPLFPLRGTISDRTGELLAWNTLEQYVYKEEDEASSTTETSSSTENTNDIAKTERLRSNDIPLRAYTKRKGFSHVLGYVSYPKRDQSGVFWQDEYVGKDGVEKQYQELLQGVKGERVIAIDALHRIEAQNVVVYPVHGANITLTIDAKVQEKLYQSIRDLAHKAPFTGGAGVIMNIHTGEILALTSYPEYDNNLMTNASSKEDNKKITEDLRDINHKFLNRAVSGLFTPGSTVKPFVALAALMEDIITPEKNIYSSGALVIENKYGGKDTVFRDWKAHGYIDMRQALAESSDEYFYQVGGGYKDQKGLGIERIDRYAKMFGFATTTGVDLPNEEYGVIPTPEWKMKIFKEAWLLGNTYHSSIGQYGFQVTPLELVRAVAALANGGYLVTPHVLSGLTYASTSLNLPERDLKVIHEGMWHVVYDKEGTGKALNIGGVEIGAKSGTAELGVSKQLVNSLITGFFPYNNPIYAFVVVMEKGARTNPYGAVYAARDTIEWMRDNTEYTK
jgi:penicillin-binding protein 2